MIENEYFECLCDLVTHDRFSNNISFRKLLSALHNTHFKYRLLRDSNRAEDGICLRSRFGFDDLDLGPCTVLEMMIALAIRCEETIMDNTEFGDRTQQWFWGMVNSLGLSGMSDDNFDLYKFDRIINLFLLREYSRDGRGGLFTIRNCDRDLRDVEIWYQLCWYLDTIT